MASTRMPLLPATSPSRSNATGSTRAFLVGHQQPVRVERPLGVVLHEHHLVDGAPAVVCCSSRTACMLSSIKSAATGPPCLPAGLVPERLPLDVRLPEQPLRHVEAVAGQVVARLLVALAALAAAAEAAPPRPPPPAWPPDQASRCARSTARRSICATPSRVSQSAASRASSSRLTRRRLLLREQRCAAAPTPPSLPAAG